MNNSKILEIVIQSFLSGIDYGLVLAEKERIQEELGDAFQGSIASKKYAMPSIPTERRQYHLQEWFNLKQKSFDKFNEIIKELNLIN